MGSPTSLTDSRLVTADASIVINLNATGCARDIVQALPHKFAVVDVVQGELEDGRRNGRHDADLLNGLAADGLLEIAQLDEAGAAFGIDAGDQVVDALLSHRPALEQDFVLAAKIIVKRGLGNVQPFGDLVERGAVVALFKKQGYGRAQHGFAFFVARAPAALERKPG